MGRRDDMPSEDERQAQDDGCRRRDSGSGRTLRGRRRLILAVSFAMGIVTLFSVLSVSKPTLGPQGRAWNALAVATTAATVFLATSLGIATRTILHDALIQRFVVPHEGTGQEANPHIG